MKLRMKATWWRGLTEHASAIRMRGSEGQAPVSSSALVVTGTALSFCLDVSKPSGTSGGNRRDACVWRRP